MDAFVYRCRNKNNWYLYVPKKEDFSGVPDPLRKLLGELDFALQFDLHPQRRLARNNAQRVIDDLKTSGYHLQIGDPLVLRPTDNPLN